MLIVCPHCSTGYDVSPGSLGDAGRPVRCARCRQTWFATAPSDMATRAAETIPAMAPANAAPPAAPAAPDPEPQRDPADATSPAPDPDTLWGVPEVAAPPLSPATVEATAAPPRAPGISDIESTARRARLAWRRSLRRGARLRIPLMPAVIAAELAAIIGILTWRAEIVRVLPQTASLFRAIGLGVNLRGVSLANVRTSTDANDGVPVLIVEGSIENVTGAVVGVPRLRFALRNAAKAELISWTAPPDRGALAPGETLAFRSRLASPPADGREIVVRFLNRRDLSGGLE
jgi:predicted Zn finger-like uncharacterized protein